MNRRLHSSGPCEEPLTNAHDRLHPEEAPPDQQWRAEAAAAIGSPTVSASEGADVLAGAADDDVLDPYQYDLAPEFYATIAELESKDKGYGAINDDNPKNWVWGRYQLTADNLKALGVLGPDGNWAGKWGVWHDADFFENKNQVQERALDEFMRQMQRNNEGEGNFAHEGAVNQGRFLETTDEFGQRFHPPLTVTEAGVQAAAHRDGQQWVREYLKWLKANGRSEGSPLPSQIDWKGPRGAWEIRTVAPEEVDMHFRRVEKRLREFENVPYRRAGK